MLTDTKIIISQGQQGLFNITLTDANDVPLANKTITVLIYSQSNDSLIGTQSFITDSDGICNGSNSQWRRDLVYAKAVFEGDEDYNRSSAWTDSRPDRLKEAITNFKNAVLTKVSSLISAHNSDAQAHESIRSAIDAKTDDTALDAHKIDPQAHSDIREEINNLLSTLYPVGSIYMSKNSTMPTAIANLGTWVKIEGRFLLGAGTSPEDNELTYTINSVGGSKNAIVVSHNHEQNAHNHTPSESSHSGLRFVVNTEAANIYTSEFRAYPSGSGDFGHLITRDACEILEQAYTGKTTATNKATGQSGVNQNMPPYTVVNIWERIR